MKVPKPEPQIPGYYCERHASRILKSSKIVSVCTNIDPIEYDLDLKTVAECGLERYFKIMEGNLRRCAGWSSKPVGAVRQSQWVRLPLSSANLSSWGKKTLKQIVPYRLLFVQKNTHQNYDGRLL